MPVNKKLFCKVEKDETVTLKAKNQREREKIVKCVSLDPQSRIEKNPSGGKRMQKFNQTFQPILLSIF